MLRRHVHLWQCLCSTLVVALLSAVMTSPIRPANGSDAASPPGGPSRNFALPRNFALAGTSKTRMVCSIPEAPRPRMKAILNEREERKPTLASAFDLQFTSSRQSSHALAASVGRDSSPSHVEGVHPLRC